MLVSVLFKEDCQLSQFINPPPTPPHSSLLTASSLLSAFSLLTPHSSSVPPPHSSSVLPHSSVPPHSSFLHLPPTQCLLTPPQASSVPQSVHRLHGFIKKAFFCNMLFDQWRSWRVVIAVSIVRKNSTGMII